MTTPVAGLERRLGLMDTALLCAGSMIGSGIFFLPAVIAGALPASGWILGAWIVGGCISLLGALALGELGAAMPEAGGMTAYLREIYGPVWGFLYGWMAAVLTNTVAIAAIAIVAAEYLAVLVPMGAAAIKLLAAAIVIGFTGLNVIGLREGATTQNLLTGLKLLLLLGLLGVALALPGGGPGQLAPVGLATGQGGSAALAVALVAVLFAYDGWINGTFVGSEVRNPGRNLPLGMLLGTAMVIACYAAVNLAFLWVLSPAGVADSPRVASDMLSALAGPRGAALVAVAVVISTLGAVNGNVLASARVPYALARQRLLPRALGSVHPRFATPHVALLAQGAWAVVLVFSGTYEELTRWMVYGSFIFYGLAAVGVVVWRRRRPDVERPYRAWGYPVTPLVFAAFSVWLTCRTILDQPRDAAIGTGLILLGLPVYWLADRRTGGQADSG